MADLSLILVTLIWGTTFTIVKEALLDVTPVRFLALRFLISGALLLAVALSGAAGAANRRALRDTGLWRDGARIGLALFGGYFTQTLGLLWATPATSAFLTGLSVVLVPLFGLPFHRERLRAWTWVGVSCSTLGLAALLLRGPGAAAGAGGGPGGPAGPGGLPLGELLTLGTAAAFAVHILLTGAYAPRRPAVALTAAQMFVAAALCVGAAPLDGWLAARGATSAPPAGLFDPLPARAWVAVVAMGVLASALAFLLQTWAQKRLPPTRTGVLFTLEPVFAAMFSALWYGERFGPRAGLGMALILAGMIVVETRGRPEPAGAGRAGGGATGGNAGAA